MIDWRNHYKRELLTLCQFLAGFTALAAILFTLLGAG